MTQALNYTVKAIEALANYPCPGAPGSAQGMRYVADKLRQAQVFVLGNSGQLLERDKPRPEVPALVFKPPFPVVALEFEANPVDWDEGYYTAAKCSRRIALAWEWSDDLPPILQSWNAGRDLGPGVVVLSIAFYDKDQAWLPISAAMHLSYDAEWRRDLPSSPFRDAMRASGRIKRPVLDGAAMQMSVVPILPEVIGATIATAGPAATTDLFAADNMDEVNAYTDLCYALSCANVGFKRHDAPPALNRQRLKAGKLPLKDFHVLELGGGEAFGGIGGGDGSTAGERRAHLRRGHIRRLPGNRTTWVNSTIVSGHGFVRKAYSI
jgi:hypothetical protein